MFAQALWDGLRGIGLEPFVEDPGFRLATVNTIKARAWHSWSNTPSHGILRLHSRAPHNSTVSGRRYSELFSFATLKQPLLRICTTV